MRLARPFEKQGQSPSESLGPLAPASAQSNPSQPTGIPLFRLDQKIHAANSALEQASRLLSDARKNLCGTGPSKRAKRIRADLDREAEALDVTRRNLALFVEKRRGEIFNSMGGKC